MAYLKIRGERDQIWISEERGKNLKAVLLDDDKKNEFLIDLGNRIIKKGLITSLEFEGEKKVDTSQDYASVEVSDEQRNKVLARMKEVRKNLFEVK